MIVVPINFCIRFSHRSLLIIWNRKSDIRIDLQQTENIEKRFKDVISYLRNDDEVEKYATFVTSTFKMVSADGTHENLHVEVGDFTTFPLDYMQGRAPKMKMKLLFLI